MQLFYDFEDLHDHLAGRHKHLFKIFSGSQCIRVKNEMVAAVRQFVDDLLPVVSRNELGQVATLFPAATKAFAPSVFILLDVDEHCEHFEKSVQRRNFALYVCAGIDGTDRVFVSVLDTSREPVGLKKIGSYTPGQVGYQMDVEYLKLLEENPDSFSLLAMTAGLFSLIAQPTLCKLVKSESRQTRRRLERKQKSAVAESAVLEWNVLGDYEKRASDGNSGVKMPLHFRRGHYRKAEPHFKGALQLPNAIREEHRDGWWQWIDGMWCGHPAYGIRRHEYTPRAPIGEAE